MCAAMILLFSVLSPMLLSAAEVPDLFKHPPRYLGPPEAGHAVADRQFQGIPSLAVAAGGRLWSVWYAGVTPDEDENNYVVVSTSADGGKTWKEVLVVDPDGTGPVRAFDPEVWVAPDGRLFLFWAQAVGHDGSVAGVWCLTTDTPDLESPQWGCPRRLTDGVMMCKPVVLLTGEWVLPVSIWKTMDCSARMVVSKDSGKTWAVRGGCNIPVDVRAYDEHTIVERKNGTLWMLVRTKYGIGESISMDRGSTWTALTPSDILHPSSRFFITRLASGNLLLVKHGAIMKKTGRSHLTAFLSTDDGGTWVGGLLLDKRHGVSYPDGQQSSDGLIRIVYDYNRTEERHIYMATFSEEDVILKKSASETVELNQVVSAPSD
ncbi:exo-alpha-sialidase [Tichowtungia aerotolerans]|uniref:Exo-alpha-sialidase n=2 Tax=Tichowtungia aerotolerans TaxID=2697043 RepID=A0A6P1MAJ3_9BACT|nr:exo-alpha-sialidase [Tichowtungia aerotolerans]